MQQAPFQPTTQLPVSSQPPTGLSLVLALQTLAARATSPGPPWASFSGHGIFKALFVVIVIA